MKECRGVFGELFFTCKEAHVGVDFGGAGVVVACAKVHVKFKLSIHLTDDLQEFGVDLKARDTVDNVSTRVFKLFGPV